MNSLYILEIKTLSELSLTTMFFYTVGSFFILMISLVMKKLFNSIKSHLFLPYFISFALEDVPGKIQLRGISEILLPMFSTRTFMVLWLTFKSSINLEFIYFCIWCKLVIKFHFYLFLLYFLCILLIML